METAAFLSHILPKQGFKFIAIKRAEDKPWIHKPTESASIAADIAEQADAKGEAVYHACASFKEAFVETGETYDNGRPKRRYRTQDNAGWAKSLWLDLDCGEKKDYPDARTAISEVFRMCNETQLPRPLLVSSGYGVHCYWVFNADVPATQWRRLARVFRAVVEHFKIKHDPSRTTDIASILRPVGTYNRKRDTPKVVKVLGDVPAQLDAAAFADHLMTLFKSHSLTIQKVHEPRVTSDLNSDLSAGTEYPPASGEEVADKCQQIRDFRNSLGDVSEPLWYACLGVVKFVIDGERLCHEWSAGHPAYEAGATQQKIDQWPAGPTTCSKFEQANPAGCAGCKFAGKIKSPIQLGTVVPESDVIEEELADDSPEIVTDIPKLPESMREKYTWKNDALCEWKKDHEGVLTDIAFLNQFIWPETHHRTDSVGTTWISRERMGKYRRFEVSAEAISTGGRDLFAAFGREGVVSNYGTKKSMEAYITDWFSALKASTDEVAAYKTFGWQKDGGFLLGDTLFTKEGERRVRVQGDALTFLEAFEPAGAVEDWVAAVDTAYNRPNNEQYQWMLGTAFGAPLVKFLGNTMAGCVVNAYSPESGLGKSTAGMVGLGLYGDPRRLMITKQQATTKGLFAYIGLMGSLPILLDEMTNVKGLELSDLVYTFSQGQGRIGATGDGGLRTNVYGWNTIMASTSNRSAQSTLAAAKANANPEIARVFEFKFQRPANVMSKVEADRVFGKATNCWGAAGREYIKFIVENESTVRDTLVKVRDLISTRAGINQDERFWAAGMSAIVTGLTLAKKLGLIKFDLGKLLDWAIRQVRTMRDLMGENETSVLEQFGTMVNQLSSGFLVTDREGDARGGAAGKAHVLHAPRGELVGRVISQTGTLYLPISVIRHWCSENQADYRQMTGELVMRQWASLQVAPFSLGKGTNDYATAPSRCYKIDLLATAGETSAMESVAQLKAVK